MGNFKFILRWMQGYMSINAISSVSLYEFYYRINRPSRKDVSSVSEDETTKKEVEEEKEEEKDSREIPADERPWADIMHQLNLAFHANPKDDIVAIEHELVMLSSGIQDEELKNEIDELISETKTMYSEFDLLQTGQINKLDNELKNLSTLNKVNLVKGAA